MDYNELLMNKKQLKGLSKQEGFHKKSVRPEYKKLYKPGQ